jgi:hypothetical protein
LGGGAVLGAEEVVDEGAPSSRLLLAVHTWKRFDGAS